MDAIDIDMDAIEMDALARLTMTTEMLAEVDRLLARLKRLEGCTGHPASADFKAALTERLERLVKALGTDLPATATRDS